MGFVVVTDVFDWLEARIAVDDATLGGRRVERVERVLEGPGELVERVRGFDFVWRAIFALTVCYSAFIAEIFRAGIEAVGRGQVEAARSLGLSRWNCFRFVIFPQALRAAIVSGESLFDHLDLS